MYRKLTSDIDLETLYSMRRQGMNNQEIADALGVSLNTVYRHIGKQPAELRKGGIRAKAVSQPQPEDESSACLAVANRILILESMQNRYEVNLKNRMLRICSDPDRGVCVALDGIEEFIDELRCIARRSENLKLENEMW